MGSFTPPVLEDRHCIHLSAWSST